MEWKSKGIRVRWCEDWTVIFHAGEQDNSMALDSFESTEIFSIANASIRRQPSSLSNHISISSFFKRRAQPCRAVKTSFSDFSNAQVDSSFREKPDQRRSICLTCRLPLAINRLFPSL